MRSRLTALTLAIFISILLLIFFMENNMLPRSRINHLSQEQMREVEQEIGLRRRILETNCRKLRSHLPREKKHLGHLRMDGEHGLAWCENYKVGSSTWAEQLLRLKGVSIGQTTPIHKVTSHQSKV